MGSGQETPTADGADGQREIKGADGVVEEAGPDRPLMRFRGTQSERLLVGVAVFALGVVVTAMRRPNQYAWPGLWNEESLVFQQWLEGGVRSVFFEINGAHPVTTRLLLGVNLELFPEDWAVANAIVAAAVVGVVASVILLAPTMLRGRWLIVVFLLFIPTDAEAFGVLLYSFWWLSLLSLISVLWRPDADRLGFRVTLGWIGALSSPVGAIFGLFGFVRFGFTRSRNDLKAALGTLPACLFTVVAVATNTQPGSAGWTAASGWADTLHLAGAATSKFVGAWVWSASGFGEIGLWHGIAGALILLLVSLAVLRRRGDWVIWVLVLGFGVSVAASVARASPEILHPFRAGPRYFFLPYFLLGAILTYIATLEPGEGRRLRSASHIIIAVALVNVAVLTTTNGLGDLPRELGFRRFHRQYDWKEELTACVEGGGLGMFHDGSRILEFPMPPEACLAVLGTEVRYYP